MTSLVAWVGADSRGPSSLNIAANSRITWRVENSAAYHWDQGKKVFASLSVPLVAGFVGDVLFPALVLPGVIDRIDRGVFRPDGSIVEGVISALRRGWRDYPPVERRNVNVYVAYRTGEGMSCQFRLTSLSHRDGVPADWTTREIPVPSSFLGLPPDRRFGENRRQGSARLVAGDQCRRHEPGSLQWLRRRRGRARRPGFRRRAATRLRLQDRARAAARHHPRQPTLLCGSPPHRRRSPGRGRMAQRPVRARRRTHQAAHPWSSAAAAAGHAIAEDPAIGVPQTRLVADEQMQNDRSSSRCRGRQGVADDPGTTHVLSQPFCRLRSRRSQPGVDGHGMTSTRRL
jgi:hypothetical protein